MTAYPDVTRWTIPLDLWRMSFDEMGADGRDGNEGVALWLGHRRAGVGDVIAAVFLRGPGVLKEPALLQISADLMNDVTDVAIERGLALIAQIHSHGPGFPIDLSYTDRTYGIAVPGYLSLVAPDYGLRPNTQPADCGVHMYRPGPGFVRLTQRDAEARVRLVERVSPAPVVVGG